jgi:hypothetical protein
MAKKPREKHGTINFRVTPERKAKMDEVAAKAGISLTQLFEEAMDLRLDMPQGFLAEIQKAAEMVHLPAAIIIANKIIKSVSFEYSWAKVFNRPCPSANMEFRFDESGLVTGDLLVEQLTQEFTQELRAAKAKLEDTGAVRPFLTHAEFETILRGLKSKSDA